MIVALTLAAQITAGAGGAYPTVTAAVAAAHPGDTVRVLPGVHREHVVVSIPLVLEGTPGAILDAGGRGTVLAVHGAGVVVRNLVIRGSGQNQSREDAGIWADSAGGLVVEGNHLEDVLFGIYLKESHRAVIRDNEVVGKDLPLSLRGDGIRLWYSHHGRVLSNRVTRSRDVVIWFSDSTIVRGNHVRDSRYGLHYMYSNANLFENNEFVGNLVGAFIMYSRDITFHKNVFADARGTSGRGLGFKDVDHVVAEGNLLVRNAVGLSIDNSPRSVGVTNEFRDNVLAYNDVAAFLLPSVHDNHFVGNTFLDNVQPVEVSGGGTALANSWSGNYWTDYAGFDGDGDGRGDTPFVLERLSDNLFAEHDELRVFNLSVAASTLDMLGQVLPFLAPEPVVIDSTPRLTSPSAAAAPTASPWLAAVVLATGGIVLAWLATRRTLRGSHA